MIPQEGIHDAVYEHLFASEYGWSIEYIESLSVKKFRQHSIILLLKKAIEASRASSGL